MALDKNKLKIDDVAVNQTVALNALDLEKQLQIAIKKLNEQNKLLADIDTRLNSWAFKIATTFGKTSKPASDYNDADLKFEDLSKAQLLTKKVVLLSEINDTYRKIHSLQGIHRQLSMDAHLERSRIQNAFDERQASIFIPTFQQDPELFFKNVLVDLQSVSPEHKTLIYKSADQLIVVSKAFTEQTDPYRVLQAWKTVMKALDVSAQDIRNLASSNTDEVVAQKYNNTHQKYSDGAKQMFTNILQILPAGMQGLMFLYAARDYDRVEFYLNEASKFSAMNNTAELDKLVNALSEEVAIVSRNNAARLLANIPEFNRLPKTFRDQLIEQQAYVNKLRFDLSFVDESNKNSTIDELSKYATKLEENIVDAIENNRTNSQVSQDFEKIKADITKRETEIRNYWFKQQLAEYPHIALGLGMGLGWILGAGAPASLMLGGLALVAKAKFETSPVRMRIFDVEEDAMLAQSVLPVDYKFIHEVDSLWGYGSSAPVTEAKVEFVSLANSAMEQMHQNVVQPIRDMHSNLERTFNVIVGVSFLSLITSGLTLPIVWPLYAAAGVFVGTGMAYYASERYFPEVEFNTAPVRSFIKLLGQAFDYFIVQPIKQVISLFRGNTEAKPDNIVALNVTNTDFRLSKEDLSILEKYSPGLATKLGAHFQARAQDLNSAVNSARQSNNNTAAATISQDVARLTADWNLILAAIPNKEQFCSTVEKYLDDRYTLEREEYVYAAKHRMKETVKGKKYDWSTKKSDMMFTKKPEFEMEFDTYYSHERKAMQDLFDLKDRIVHIKRHALG